jgi:Methyltransferase domain
LRSKRDVQLRSLIQSIASKKGSIRILDMGGTLTYWKRVGIEFLRGVNASITIVNLSAAELDGDEVDGITNVVGDACRLTEHPDRSFDLAHSNSVIEHVLTWPNMKAFATETRRLAGSYYVQTPYFWFPVDPHYYRAPLFHWLPRPARARLLSLFPIAHAGRIRDLDMVYDVVDDARLLDLQQFRLLFPDSELSFERFCGLPKSMIAVRQGVGEIAPRLTG